MRTLALVALAASLLSGSALAQSPSSPVLDALRLETEHAQRNLVAAAQSMPAGKFGFKPTPAQMSFGELMLHIAGANDFMCSTISGTKAPDEPKLQPTAKKEELVGRVRRSFQFCTDAFGKLDDRNLGETVPFFGGRTISRAGAVLDLVADWADHYGASAIYLRLNGVLPPTAKKTGASE
jgi:DinB family protein